MPIVRKRIDNARLGTVLSNSFGFGGTNATLVFKRMDAEILFSPRPAFCGERSKFARSEFRVRGEAPHRRKFGIRGRRAPHPNPLPAKCGAREQTERVMIYGPI